MPIGFGDLVTCDIGTIGDSDLFQFGGASGERVVTHVVINSGGSPDLELRRPDGSLFASDATIFNTARVSALLDQSGTWRLVVRDFGNDSTPEYTLSLERLFPTATTATPLCKTHFRVDRLDPVADVDLLTFSGQSGESAVVQMVVNEGGSPSFEIYRPDGSLFASDGTIFNTARIDPLLDQSGTWVLLLLEFGNDGAIDYTVNLETISPCTPVEDLDLGDQTVDTKIVFEACGAIRGNPELASSADVSVCAGQQVAFENGLSVDAGAALRAVVPAFGTPIAYGSLVQSSLTPLADSDIYRFEGFLGEAVLIQLVINEGGSPALELFRPDGSLFASDGTIFNTATIDEVLDQSGTWTIVTREFGNDSTAPYTLTLSCVGGCA